MIFASHQQGGKIFRSAAVFTAIDHSIAFAIAGQVLEKFLNLMGVIRSLGDEGAFPVCHSSAAVARHAAQMLIFDGAIVEESRHCLSSRLAGFFDAEGDGMGQFVGRVLLDGDKIALIRTINHAEFVVADQLIGLGEGR